MRTKDKELEEILCWGLFREKFQRTQKLADAQQQCQDNFCEVLLEPKGPVYFNRLDEPVLGLIAKCITDDF